MKTYQFKMDDGVHITTQRLGCEENYEAAYKWVLRWCHVMRQTLLDFKEVEITHSIDVHVYVSSASMHEFPVVLPEKMVRDSIVKSGYHTIETSNLADLERLVVWSRKNEDTMKVLGHTTNYKPKI